MAASLWKHLILNMQSGKSRLDIASNGFGDILETRIGIADDRDFNRLDDPTADLDKILQSQGAVIRDAHAIGQSGA
jgi:hypothetical protein